MEKTLEEKLASLEALLFIHGEPLATKKIQAIMELSSPEETTALIEEFKKRLDVSERGLTLISDAEKIQLVTKPAFGKIIEAFIKEELSEDLTPASVETLAVISYFAPLSRSRIEYLRGVNSTFILRALLMRGLIERLPNPQNPNTFLYQPSFDMLRYLGLEKKESLPDFEKFQGMLKKFESGESVSEQTPIPDAAPMPPQPAESEEPPAPPPPRPQIQPE